jgi:hypothetical protein
MNGRGKDKPAYCKVRLCVERAAKDGIRYFWIDTCCIDKQRRATRSNQLNLRLVLECGQMLCICLTFHTIPQMVMIWTLRDGTSFQKEQMVYKAYRTAISRVLLLRGDIP